MLFTHYRSPLDFSWEKMEEAKRAYERIRHAIEDLDMLKNLQVVEENKISQLYEKVKEVEEAFFEDLSEDFNTPSALSRVFGLVSELGKVKNRAISERRISRQDLSAYEFAVSSILRHMRGIFGLFEDIYPEKPVREVVRRELEAGQVLDERLIDILVDVRNQARAEKVFKIADYIRDRLKEVGIVLEDTPAGTKWRKL